MGLKQFRMFVTWFRGRNRIPGEQCEIWEVVGRRGGGGGKRRRERAKNEKKGPGGREKG